MKPIHLEVADEIEVSIKRNGTLIYHNPDIKGYVQGNAIAVGTSAKVNVPKQHLSKLPAKVFVVILK